MYMCVHKIMNMYIHGMYMVQTCMNRFAHLRGGGRIPDEYILSESDTCTYRYVPSTYCFAHSCTKFLSFLDGTYRVHTGSG